ncbi:MAG: polyribonucleotide nucleotidyltransferase, partial [bacterium]|nr:polyribonucleotide nucleotidyltransferase [bacterium]
ITMVEGESKEVDEDTLIAAIAFGHAAIREICQLQDRLIATLKKPLREYELSFADADLEAKIAEAIGDDIVRAARTPEKQERNLIRKAAAVKAMAAIGEENADKAKFVSEVLDKKLKAEMRKRLIAENTRIDGRDPKTIRQITIETRILPRPHGSALFTRGQTQALGVCTLGSKFDEQRIDALEGNYFRRFMLHYNFPSFSTGETKRQMGPSRREIGHGNLAERSISVVLPEWDAFPYTIRVVSEVLESNGSSSMATVCAASLSLMDAGVPLKRPVAGIAMGLVKEGDQAVILSDILGDEDALGDMDFKVAGTREGITAFQMDIKIQGISLDLMRRALQQAHEGRAHILGLMETALPSASPQLSDFAPKIVRVSLDQDKIGLLIGPGGKNIRELAKRTECTVDVDDDGTVVVCGLNVDGVRDAYEHVMGLMMEPEVGKIYRGRITRIVDFGAFVEILPGREGLMHISNISHERVQRVDDVVKLGEYVEVKLLAVDPMGKMDLSRKALLPDKDGVIGGTQSSEGRTRGPSRGGDRRPGGGGHRR